jgi:hypothetical protein
MLRCCRADVVLLKDLSRGHRPPLAEALVAAQPLEADDAPAREVARLVLDVVHAQHLARREGQWLPASLNVRELDPVCTFDLLREPREATVRTVLTNSFGFGGANATLIFQKEGVR